MSTDFANPVQVAQQAAGDIRRALNIDSVDIALVLGSGWNQGADALGKTLASADLGEITGFSKPVVAGHGGQVRAVTLSSGKTALVLTGRTHFYEGRGVEAVVHGVRTAAALGAKIMVLTNGCGGLNPAWAPGTPVLIRDHINLTGATPLRGATFIDMSDTYTSRLRDVALKTHPELDQGVYVQFGGPQYETPAEVRMAEVLGGDLVGMSTALEAIAAREAGMEILGVSLVTNAAAGMSEEALDHTEVVAAGKAAGPKLAALMRDLVSSL